jgi:beta-lactam-binding protein with PASTA domain
MNGLSEGPSTVCEKLPKGKYVKIYQAMLRSVGMTYQQAKKYHNPSQFSDFHSASCPK